MLLDAVDHRVALGAAETALEEFHDARIGIHRGKRLPILVTPCTQTDAAARQCHNRAHRGALLSAYGAAVGRGRRPRNIKLQLAHGSSPSSDALICRPRYLE